MTTTLPPLGPAWFPAAMGTGILATLLQLAADRVPLAHAGALAVFGVAWGVLGTLVVGFALRVRGDRAVLVASVRDLAQAPMWGTVAMAFLAVGSATATVVPATWPGLTGAAWALDGAMWVVGTLLGLGTAIGFTLRLIRADGAVPTTIWGLAVVGPMVSATTGAALVPHAGPLSGALLAVATACFATSLLLGAPLFAVAYHHHWRVAPLALSATCSAWVPLGLVGQSTAAAQALAGQAGTVLAPASVQAAQAAAAAYGVVALSVGVPLIGWALRVTVRGFAAHMPFTPGWWALTFPVGTLALGATFLGHSLGSAALGLAGLVLTGALVGTVSLCGLATLAALADAEAGRRRTAGALLAVGS